MNIAPSSFPTSRVSSETDLSHLEVTRTARLVARVIDFTLFSIAAIAAMIAVLVLAPAGGTPLDVIMSDTLELRMGIALVVAAFPIALLQGYLLARHGQTVGKRLLGLRIVQTNGAPASALRTIVLRELVVGMLATIPVLGTIVSFGFLTILGADRRCLHDYVAGTRVLSANGTRGPTA